MSKKTLNFIKSEDGTAVAEYAIVIAFLTVALIIVISVFKDAVVNSVSKSSTVISTG